MELTQQAAGCQEHHQQAGGAQRTPLGAPACAILWPPPTPARGWALSRACVCRSVPAGLQPGSCSCSSATSPTLRNHKFADVSSIPSSQCPPTLSRTPPAPVSMPLCPVLAPLAPLLSALPSPRLPVFPLKPGSSASGWCPTCSQGPSLGQRLALRVFLEQRWGEGLSFQI